MEEHPRKSSQWWANIERRLTQFYVQRTGPNPLAGRPNRKSQPMTTKSYTAFRRCGCAFRRMVLIRNTCRSVDMSCQIRRPLDSHKAHAKSNKLKLSRKTCQSQCSVLSAPLTVMQRQTKTASVGPCLP